MKIEHIGKTDVFNKFPYAKLTNSVKTLFSFLFSDFSAIYA